MSQTLLYIVGAALLVALGAAVGPLVTDSVPTSPSQPEATSQAHRGHSPYAGQQARELTYLAPEDVSALEAGRGTALGGLAKPAELNGYPGPRHALDLADELELTEDQRQRLQALFDQMQTEAQAAGQAFLDVERQIDAAYAQQTVTDEELGRLLERSGELYGRLRYVHLRYHLETRALLSETQIQRYNEIRGYAGAPGDDS